MAAPARRRGRSRRQLRKDMPAVGRERQWLDPQHAGERQRAIEMWKQRALARWLPAERCTKAARINGNQQQIGPTGEMLGRRLLDLAGGGEMDVAVTHVDPGATESS